MADDDGPNNLIHFPRVGFTDPTEPPAQAPGSGTDDVPFAAGTDAPTSAPEEFAPATRTSPLEAIAALPEPGLGTPFPATPQTGPVPASPGVMAPATFRSEAAQPAAPRLGALSLAAILAVSLAAMRGIHSAVSTYRANREQRQTVANTASTGTHSSSGGSSKKQLQAGHEWGRTSLKRGPGGHSGRSGGAGPGRSGRGGGSLFGGSGSGRRSSATTKSPSSSGGGRGGGSGSGSGGGRSTSSGKGGGGITPLKRSSQGGGPTLKKSRGPGSSKTGGSGGGSKQPSSGGGAKRSAGGRASGGSSSNRKRGSGTSGPRTSGPGSKKPGTGAGRGGGTSSPKRNGPGAGKAPGKGAGTKSGAKKSPRGTTGPAGILRKKPGTTTAGTGPKKRKGKSTTGPGSTGPASPAASGKKSKSGKRRAGKGTTVPATPGPKAPGGKSRKGKKVTLTPGIAHGTFAATDKYGCRCRKCRRFNREYSRKVLGAMKSAARGRTTFGEAVHETAQTRLKRRRRKLRPPVVAKVKVTKPKTKTGPKTKTAPSGSPKPAGPAPSGPSGPAAMAPRRRTPWSTAKERARKRARMRAATMPGPRPAPGSPQPAATAPGAPGAGPVPGAGSPRMSPFEAIGMATAGSAPAGPITVERADAGPAAPATGGGLPTSTSSTKENHVKEAQLTHDAWLVMWGDGGIAEMHPEHQTEVTLDDTLDLLEKLTKESFKAHETCRRLSIKARKLRHALDELAADLRSTHNVIGRLTGAAMGRLAESMEVLARKADEMSTKSLLAAELCETAENAMFDAYRPLQQATEDTGLAVPAARIHNEN